MQTTTVTQKGQITIPIEVRRELNLKPGDRVEFITQNHEVKIFKKKTNIKDSFGILKVKKIVSLKQIEDAIKQGPMDDFN